MIYPAVTPTPLARAEAAEMRGWAAAHGYIMGADVADLWARLATVAHRREAADKARRYRSAQHGLQREKRRLRRRGDRAGMAANAELRRELYAAWEAWKAART